MNTSNKVKIALVSIAILATIIALYVSLTWIGGHLLAFVDTQFNIDMRTAQALGLSVTVIHALVSLAYTTSSKSTTLITGTFCTTILLGIFNPAIAVLGLIEIAAIPFARTYTTKFDHEVQVKFGS